MISTCEAFVLAPTLSGLSCRYSSTVFTDLVTYFILSTNIHSLINFEIFNITIHHNNALWSLLNVLVIMGEGRRAFRVCYSAPNIVERILALGLRNSDHSKQRDESFVKTLDNTVEYSLNDEFHLVSSELSTNSTRPCTVLPDPRAHMSVFLCLKTKKIHLGDSRYLP